MNNLFRAINARRTIPLDRFIFALGIRHVGETNAGVIARAYGSLDAFLTAVRDAADRDGEAYRELLSIGGIGEVVANAILEFFNEPQNVEAIEALLREVTVEPVEAARSDSPVAGKTVVFTGALERMTRDEARASTAAFTGAGGFDATIEALHEGHFTGGAAVVPPATIAWGDKDKLLLPRQAERARRAIPQARHLWLPGCGHLPMVDDPETTARAILTS